MYLCRSLSCLVSIPYRLATNDDERAAVVIARTMFQSLIGQLQTRCLHMAAKQHCKFQSLIGQLQTSNHSLKQPVLLQSFNPLQVSYKRESWLDGRRRRTKVSIPYRLATNEVCFSLRFRRQWLVSIPYRLATNYGMVPIFERCTEFQSLIGQLQTQRILP